MKIGIFLGELRPEFGGAYSYQATVVQALIRNKGQHELVFFHYGDSGMKGSTGASFVSLGSRRPQSLPPLQKAYRNLKKAIDTKLLELPETKAQRLSEAAVKAKVEVLWFPSQDYEYVRVPFIYTVWDLQHRLQPYFPEVTLSGSDYDCRETVFQAAVPRASYIICPNEAGKQEVMNFYGVPKERIFCLPQPASQFVFDNLKPKSLKGLWPTQGARPYLFYPAQFWPHKNHVMLLHALRLLKDTHKLDFDLVLTGSDKGNLKHVFETAEQLGVRSQVHHLGFVENEVLVSLYKEAFALAFASFFGPENMPPMEAFALGTPVIASRVSGAEIQMKDAALYFNPTSEREFVECVLKLQMDIALRERLVSKGKSITENWTPDIYINKLISIFEDFGKIRRLWSKSEEYIHT